VRDRLLATLAGPERFASFIERLAHLFDLPRAGVRELLARIDDGGGWLAGYVPDLQYFNFTPGPRLAGADAGFVRLRPGGRFPRHRHVGDEVTFILEGAMRDGDQLYRPGALVERARDTVHDYAAEGPRDLVLVSLHRGIVPA
jgi:putative transcriptional regulator